MCVVRRQESLVDRWRRPEVSRRAAGAVAMEPDTNNTRGRPVLLTRFPGSARLRDDDFPRAGPSREACRRWTWRPREHLTCDDPLPCHSMSTRTDELRTGAANSTHILRKESERKKSGMGNFWSLGGTVNRALYSAPKQIDGPHSMALRGVNSPHLENRSARTINRDVGR